MVSEKDGVAAAPEERASASSHQSESLDDGMHLAKLLVVMQNEQRESNIEQKRKDEEHKKEMSMFRDIISRMDRKHSDLISELKSSVGNSGNSSASGPQTATKPQRTADGRGTEDEDQDFWEHGAKEKGLGSPEDSQRRAREAREARKTQEGAEAGEPGQRVGDLDRAEEKGRVEKSADKRTKNKYKKGMRVNPPDGPSDSDPSTSSSDEDGSGR